MGISFLYKGNGRSHHELEQLSYRIEWGELVKE
jgi:hypothetical protein